MRTSCMSRSLEPGVSCYDVQFQFLVTPKALKIRAQPENRGHMTMNNSAMVHCWSLHKHDLRGFWF